MMHANGSHVAGRNQLLHRSPPKLMKKSTLFSVLLLLVFFGSPAILSAKSDDEYEHLKVPVDDFVASVNSTLERVERVMKLVSKHRNVSKDVSLSHCLDMLDASSEKLGWILEASLGVNVGTGDLSSDFRTWLSSVLANQDSCMDQGLRRASIKRHLDKISSSVTEALAMVKPTSPEKKQTGVPPWLRSRKITITKAMAHVVVALDDSGNFTTISEAVNAAPEKSVEPFVIYVKGGIYKEYVMIPKDKWNIVMIGDGMGVTVITGDRSYKDGYKTFNSATFAVKGRGFIGQNMTFENTAGPEKSQAVAYLSDSDLSVLYKCSILGYQDTFYAYSQRQLFKRCEIHGTVDFIFGRSLAVFQDCLIVARKGLQGQQNTITAQGRQSFREISAFSLQFCTITADSEVTNSSVETYLGRPWQEWSTTMIMQSEISDAIAPRGWLEWNGSYALDTLYYAEYWNNGPGANVSSRVTWPGYHIVTDEKVANLFTVTNLIAGNSWLPATGIEYVAGLV